MQARTRRARSQVELSCCVGHGGAATFIAALPPSSRLGLSKSKNQKALCQLCRACVISLRILTGCPRIRILSYSVEDDSVRNEAIGKRRLGLAAAEPQRQRQ